MTHNARPRCRYVVRDAFGRRLAEHRGGLQVSFSDFCANGPVQGELIVPVHAGSDQDFRDEVDRICAAAGAPSVGVQLLPTRLVVGPTVVPGRTACYACFRRRAAQHAGTAKNYDIDAAVSGLPEGFGPQHLSVASGLVELARTEIVEGIDGIGATVRSFSLISGAVAASVTVSVDRCARCGDRFAAARAVVPAELR